MLELFTIAGKIDLKGADEASKSLDKIDGKGQSTASKMGGVAKSIGKGVAIVGAAAVAMGTAAFVATKKVTDGFDDIAKTSTKMGISTDAYQEMDYWASQNGISSGNMEKAVGRLNQRIGMAAEGNEKYGSALSALGIDMDSVKDGSLSTEDAMYQSIQALSEVESETEKAALASELFGTKLGRELMPALQDGSLSLEDAKQKAKELGIVIDGDTLSAAEHFNDTWDDLTRSMQAFAGKLIAQLMPAFQIMMDWVISHMPQIQATFSAVFDAIGVVIDVAKGWFTDLMSILSEWFGRSETDLSGIWNTYSTYLTLVWDLVKSVYGHIEDIITTVMPIIFDVVSSVLTSIADFWSNNGDNIMTIVEFAFNFIKGVIDFVMPLILFIIEDVFNAVKNVIQGALDVVLGIVGIFSSLFTGDWQGLWDSVKQLLSGAVQLIWGLINLWFIGKILKVGKTFVKMFQSIFSKAWSFITGLFTRSVSSVGSVVSSGFGVIRSVISSIMNVVKSVISTVWNVVKSVFSSTVSVLKSVVSSGFNLVRSVITSVMNVIRSVISKVWNVISKVFSNTISRVRSVVSSGFNAVRSVVSSVMNAIRSVISRIWNGIRSVISSVISSVRSVVTGGFNAIRSVVTSVMSAVRSVVTSVWSAIRNTISRVVNGVKSTISSVFGSLSGIASRAFNAVKDAMTKPVDKAKNLIKSAIDAIKGFFSGLKLKFPKITMPKMPKFSLKGKFGLKPPSVPKLGIKWNADGGIFNKPTIFNTENAGMQGVGEAGSEAILPLNKKTLGGIGSMIASTMDNRNNGNQSVVQDTSRLEALLIKLIDAVKNNKDVYIDGEKVTDKINEINAVSDLGKIF